MGAKSVDVTIIGGGMITNDLLLPSVYHLQRTGVVGNIKICALNSGPLEALRNNGELQEAFPGQSFTAFPSFDNNPLMLFPDLYKEVLGSMPPRQAVIVAMPDQLHFQVVMDALRNNQHVLCVKPLVLKYEHTALIEKTAYEHGLFVGVEYHKRFDRRSLMAKKAYAMGQLGQFVMGEAKMIEPYYYRSSNFQNWFTCENSDPFVYVGCHYVDLVFYITGLKPVEVSVQGIKGTFPNGNEGFFWANGRVRFENDSLLSVTDGLGYPDGGGGANEQCLSMFFENKGRTGLIKHDDQFRGVSYCFNDERHGGGSLFRFVSPDFYRLVPWEGAGYKPVGYGFESVAASINSIHALENAVAGLEEKSALVKRRALIEDVDRKGIIATPANSYANELVTEAARASILANGHPAKIEYGDVPCVALR